jgi:predicted AAA+ superfamily ATPase
MIIIHGVNGLHTHYLQRFLEPVVEAALSQFPVVVVTGARQTGKSTLVRNLPSAALRSYATLDDLDVLDRAQRSADSLVGTADALTLDEVQRVPRLLLAIKREVDKDRRKGRFLLTGSANLLLMRRVSESLAGRAVYLTRLPMSAREKRGAAGAGPWQSILTAKSVAELRDKLPSAAETTDDWMQSALIGGYPSVVFAESESERTRWFDGYVRTYLERDLQDVASISALADFRRVMGLSALRLGQIVNQTEIARDAALSQATVHRYLNLLEASYQIVRVPAYTRSRSKRLIKAPKLYWVDTGLASFLLGITTTEELHRHNLAGALLENLVYSQLLIWREAQAPRPEIFYWRTATGAEVDFVVEQRNGLIPIEIKMANRPQLSDLRALEMFLDDYPKLANFGLLIYGGDEVVALTSRIIAVPARAFL